VVIRDNSIEYDDYDPNDVPADQAAPESLASYGQANQPTITDNSQQAELESYSPGVPQVATSAPVPEVAFSLDSQAPSSFDSYNTNSLAQPVIEDNLNEEIFVEPNLNEEIFVDLTQGSGERNTATVEEEDKIVFEEASVLPPVVDLTDFDYDDDSDDIKDIITLKVKLPKSPETATAAPAPVLFTYAPGTTSGPENRRDRFARLAKGLSKLSNKRLYYKLLINDFYHHSQ
jgi:hypothetical protein